MSDDPAAAVGDLWGLPGARVRPLSGGMDSRTWLVEVTASCGRVDRWAAKQVIRDQHDPFVRGLRAAGLVERAGVRAGAPRPTTDGADHADLPDGPLALLRWVEGVALDGDDDADSSTGRARRTGHCSTTWPRRC